MSGLLGGGGSSQSHVAPMEASLRVQTSAYGLTVPLVYGTTRVSVNLMWYGDFKAIPHTTSTKVGKGSRVYSTTYTYSASLMMGLTEGPIYGVGTVWKDKEIYTPTKNPFTVKTGDPDFQSPWSYLTTKYPTQALAYRGIAYVAAANYDLGSSASTPNHSFEVLGLLLQDDNDKDIEPSRLAEDFLTNEQYGAGFPSSYIYNWQSYDDYTVASGLLFSPQFISQSPAHEFITQLAKITNSGFFWSDGYLKVTPYGDTAITAHGATYTPNLTPAYELTDEDYIHEGNSDPVVVNRSATADAYNKVQIEFLNRANQYNIEIAEAKDQVSIELYGERAMEPIKAHEICDATVARSVAQLVLQRVLYVRNVYEFVVGARFALLEPTDYVTITDTTLGLQDKPVRILTIEERDDYTFRMTAEDAPPGVSSNAIYDSPEGAGHQNDFSVSPGDTNTPVLFEAPLALTTTNGGLELWVAASGGAYWGGCQVWVSYDDQTYTQVASINVPSTQGVLTTILPNGSDPDTTNSFGVDLTMSRTELIGGTQQDADNYTTLCYVDGELVSFQAATLTGSYKYTLGTYLRRGVYYTSKGSHAIGTQFVRINDAIGKVPFTADKVGKTLYVKLPAFNVYGAGQQTLAEVSPVTVTLQGSALKTPPNAVTSLTATFAQTLTNATCTLTWPNVVAPLGIAGYVVSWTGNTVQVNSNTLTVPVDWQGNRTFTIYAVDQYGNQGAGFSSTVNKPAPPNVTGFGSAIVNRQLVLSWNAVNSSALPVVAYEIRTADSGWGGSGSVFKSDALTTTVTPPAAGSTTTWYIRALDTSGAYSAASATASYTTVAPPNISGITSDFGATSLTNSTVTLRWTDAAPQFGLSNYAVTYAGVTINIKSNSITVVADWLGDRQFTVVTVDSFGNQSTGYSQNITRLAPNPVTSFTAQVIDNNVMLYWALPTKTTLPILSTRLRKGATFATSVDIGTKSGSFTAINETKGGDYTYWITVVDTAGTESSPVSLRASVDQPPDFVFNKQWVSTFSGTIVNGVVDSSGLTLLVNTTETYQSHFQSRGYSTWQDQINAGYPYYLQPGVYSASYTETFDYGQVLASSSISLIMQASTLAGTVTQTLTLSISSDGIYWTDYAGLTNIFAVNFRYVKVAINLTQATAGSIYNISSLTLTLDSKVQRDAGQIYANAFDAGGTVVNFNKEFVDVSAINVSPQANDNRLAVADFKDTVYSCTWSIYNNSPGSYVLKVVTPSNTGLKNGQKVRLAFTSGPAFAVGVIGIYTIDATYSATELVFALPSGWGTSGGGNVTLYPQSMSVYLYRASDGARYDGYVNWQLSGY